jgi:hypothetical protein
MYELNLLKKAFNLTNKSISIVLFTTFIDILPILMVRRPLFFLAYFIFLCGWYGVKISLLNEIYTNGYSNWNKFKSYFLKYFPRFLPIFFLIVLFLIISAITLIVLVISKTVNSTEISLYLKSFNTDYKTWIPWMFSFSLFAPYTLSFIPVVVLKDVSFWKGIKETYNYLSENLNVYILLLICYIFNYLILKMFMYIPGFDNTSSNLSVIYVIRALITAYSGIFLISIAFLPLKKK